MPWRSVCVLAVTAMLAAPLPAAAQRVEVTPFGGYRFGNDLYEVFTGRAIDADGAASYGVTVDLFVERDASISFLYGRQDLQSVVRDPIVGTSTDRLFAEYYHVGGTYELDGGRVRPLLAGGIGLTRFGGGQLGTEVRFSAGGGGGVKLMATRHVGVRLDGRLHAVFVDARLGPTICGGGGCLIDVDVFVVWQAEFTAGLVVAF